MVSHSYIATSSSDFDTSALQTYSVPLTLPSHITFFDGIPNVDRLRTPSLIRRPSSPNLLTRRGMPLAPAIDLMAARRSSIAGLPTHNSPAESIVDKLEQSGRFRSSSVSSITTTSPSALIPPANIFRPRTPTHSPIAAAPKPRTVTVSLPVNNSECIPCRKLAIHLRRMSMEAHNPIRYKTLLLSDPRASARVEITYFDGSAKEFDPSPMSFDGVRAVIGF